MNNTLSSIFKLLKYLEDEYFYLNIFLIGVIADTLCFKRIALLMLLTIFYFIYICGSYNIKDSDSFSNPGLPI